MKFKPLYIIQLFIAILPLFFTFFTRDFVDYNKNILIMALSLTAVAAYALKTFRSKKLSIRFDKIHIAILALAFSYLLSLLLMSPNKVEALLQPGGAGTIFSLTLLYFVLPELITIPSTKTVVVPLLFSGVLITLFTVLDMLGITFSLPVLQKLQNPAITPAGTLLGTTLFLAVVSIVSAKEIIMSKINKTSTLLIYGILFLIVLAGTITNIFRLTDKNTRPALLPTSASWAIAAENIKVPKQALFGVGAGNYVNAFTIGKPASLNLSDVWNIRFNSASNYILHVFTETGILGLLSLLALIYFVIQKHKASTGAITVFIILAILPHNVLLLFLLFLFLIVLSSKTAKRYIFPTSRIHHSTLASALGIEKNSIENISFIPIVFSLILFLLSGLGLYYLSQAYRAEIYMTKGILSATTPNNQQTYDFQKKALQLNPYMSDYRVIFSRTNLLLARLISQKKDITDQEKQTVTQLVIQAVNNGKAAVTLKPSSSTWTNLATIYQSLIGSAKGAENWAAQSYAQAIAFDRTNPLLRLNLGQMFYALKLYSQASRQFELATQLKPDFANAWYNLANTYRELKNYQLARLAYNQTLLLIPKDSSDFETVTKELEALPNQLSNKDKNLQQLQPPDVNQTENIETPVELQNEQASPELTFPESVAKEATQSATSPQQPTINTPTSSPAASSLSPTISPTAFP